MEKEKNFFRVFLFCLLFLGFLFLSSQKVNLLASDLGRHLKNGEVILKEGLKSKVIFTNFYSYTYPDNFFWNHHWGSGVIFFLIKNFLGFRGLFAFYLLISGLTFFLFLLIAKEKGSFKSTFFAGVFLLPLLSWRSEIRPEVFSYFFSGIFLFLLSSQVRFKKFFWVLPLIELFWVNVHVYFFLGFVWVVIFLAEAILEKDKVLVKKLGFVLILCLLASIFNPLGIKGSFYPLRIFDNYGYLVLENQSIFYLDKLIDYPAGIFFKLSLGGLVLSFLLRWFWGKEKRVVWSEIFLGVLVSFLALKAVRNFSLFAFVSWILFSSNLVFFNRGSKKDLGEFFSCFLGGIIVFMLLFFLKPSFWIYKRKNFGLGLVEGGENAGVFFKARKIFGPIFNDYDIGSYLIYYLYPDQKVFVDNRPEAYPQDFFQKIYIPMQENEEVWRSMEERYKFSSIFFYKHDLTPWAQSFLSRRLQDVDWKVVYADDYAVILVKNEKK